ncbi:hypothetical protein [Larkinella harenae]
MIQKLLPRVPNARELFGSLLDKLTDVNSTCITFRWKGDSGLKLPNKQEWFDQFRSIGLERTKVKFGKGFIPGDEWELTLYFK